jgi:hypothetical protein
MADELKLGQIGEKYYTTDAHGARVLYGLTAEETAELEDLRQKWWSDHTSRDGTRSYASAEERNAMRARRLELDAKHKRAWTEVIGAQIALNNNAQRH